MILIMRKMLKKKMKFGQSDNDSGLEEEDEDNEEEEVFSKYGLMLWKKMYIFAQHKPNHPKL